MMRKIRKEVALIAAVFLLLCIISLYRQIGMRQSPTELIRPVIIYFTYVLLLAGWWGTVSNRVTQRNMRKFLLAESIFMYLSATIRFIHDVFTYYFTNEIFALSQSAINLARFSGYLHALPIVIIPLLGLYASFGLGKTEEYRFARNRYFLLLPAGLLALLLLTNESHHLLFLPLQDEPQAFLYYHPKAGFYVMMAWAFLLVLLRAFVIYRASREPGVGFHYPRVIPLIFTILLILVNVPYISSAFVVEYELMEQSILLFFLEIMVWESSILVGMVPVNTHYDEVFDRSTISMQIINNDSRLYLKSSGSSELAPGMIQALTENQSTYTPEGMELHMHPIRGGYVIWKNDMSETIAVIDELRSVAERLEHEDELLREELAIKSDEAAVKEQNRIYNQLTDEVGGQLVLLRNLLDEQGQAADKATLFKTICLIGAYIKRRCNLRLVEQSDGIIPNQELDLCYSEILGSLGQIGIEASLTWRTEVTLTPEFAIFTLDIFELLLEHESFELVSIQATFETDALFSVQVRPISDPIRQLPIDDLQRMNKEQYEVDWYMLGDGYRITVRS